MEYDDEYVTTRSAKIKSGPTVPAVAKDLKHAYGYVELRDEAGKSTRFGSLNKDFLACVINELFEDEDIPERYKNFRGRELNELAGGLFKKAMMLEFLRETGIMKSEESDKIGVNGPRFIALLEEKKGAGIHEIVKESHPDYVPFSPVSPKYGDESDEE